MRIDHNRRGRHLLVLLPDETVLEILEVAFKLEGDVVVEKVKIGGLAIVEAFQIAVLLLIWSSGVGLVYDSLHYLPHVLVVQERPFQVGPAGLIGESEVVHVLFFSELSIIEHAPMMSVIVIDNKV